MTQSLTDTALDVQAELLGWVHTDHGRRYVGAEFAVVAQANRMRSTVLGESPEDMARREGPRVIQQTLRQGATFAVSSDIVTVLETAARSLKPYGFHPSDLPAPCGFVWLEHPIVIHDGTAERKPMVMRAFGWFSGVDIEDEHGLLTLHWTEPLDPRDHGFADFTLDHDMIRNSGISPPRGLWSMVSGVWRFDDADDALIQQESQMFLLAFLRFIDEPWIEPGHSLPSRPAGRRAARAEIEPRVRVIRLRKRKEHASGDPTGTGSKWTKRVLVGAATGGFWRNQWYPAHGVHRARWIWPYEAGPADAPLDVPDVAFRVDR